MKSKRAFNRILAGLLVLCSLLLTLIAQSYHVLPNNARYLLFVVLFIVNIVAIYWANQRMRRFKRRLLSGCLILGLALTGGATYLLFQGVQMVTQVTDKPLVKEESLSLIVKADSPYKAVSDLQGQPVLAPVDQEGDLIDRFMKQITTQFEWQPVKTYAEGAQALLNGKGQALLLNEAYRPMIEDQLDQFASTTRILTEKTSVTSAPTVEAAPVARQASFNIYLSGIDTYGSLTNVSRSDVNLVATVNPSTHQLLLTTIPRDSYVKIAGGGNNQYDKLTHAGIYGVDASIQTLEQLLDTQINYYARVNFTAIQEIVDLLGGVTVHNDQAFSVGEHNFPAGDIQLSGEEALIFARERYSLAGGDLDRGRNHMKLIEGLVDQALQPKNALNAAPLLAALLKHVDTNMPVTKIMELVNQQLTSNQDWTVTSQSISGQGTMDQPSYAMPGYQLYMYELDPASVSAASQAIQDTLKSTK